MLCRLALALAVLVAACHDPAPFTLDPDDGFVCGAERALHLPVWEQRSALDVLVVLDRSPSMSDQATELAAMAATFDRVFQTFPGCSDALHGVPDLRFAVVTSDLGARGVSGCGDGPGGAFHAPARCGLDRNFIEARGLVAGGVRGNFPGTLADALACVLDAPLSTCPVSQPLGAVIRALDGTAPANAGFRRDHAALMVFIVTDGDDCTLAASTALSDVTAASDLEGAIDVACFQRGAREDAGIASVSALVARIRGFASRYHRVALSIVAAPGAPVVLEGDRLADACTGNSVATAAPRLASIGLDPHDMTTDVCGGWSGAIDWMAELVRCTLGIPCVPDEFDLDPATPGIQANCASRVTTEAGDTVAPLPWCDAPDVDLSRPCVSFVDEPACYESGARLEWSLGDTRLPIDIRLELRCEIACEAE